MSRVFLTFLLVSVPALALHVGCSSDDTTPGASLGDAGAEAAITADASADAALEAGPRPNVVGACGAARTSTRYGSDKQQSIFQSGEGANGVAFAADGSLWVTGEVRDAVDLGMGTLSPGGANAWMFLVHLDAQGQTTKSAGFGDPASGLIYAPSARGRAIAVGADDAPVVAGSFAGSIDFGGGTLVSAGPANDAGAPSGGCITGAADCSPDAVVVAFDPAGAHKWSRRFGGPGADVATAVATDAAGNVFVTGSFSGTASFGTSAGAPVSLTAVAKTDLFVVKLDKDGDTVFAKRYGSVEDVSAQSIALAPDGSIVIGGRYAGIALFGSVGLSARGTYDGFVAKLDAAGDAVWAQRLIADRGQVSGVAVGADGRIVVAGEFRTSMNFGALGGQKSAYIEDAFVARMTPSGEVSWVKVFGADGGERATSVAVDAKNLIHVTGRNDAVRGMDFGGGPIGGGLYPGAFVATLTETGAHVCSRSYAGARLAGAPTGDGGLTWAGASGDAIAIAPDGRIAVAGSFAATIDFGLGAMTSALGSDAFVATFSPSP